MKNFLNDYIIKVLEYELTKIKCINLGYYSYKNPNEIKLLEDSIKYMKELNFLPKSQIEEYANWHIEHLSEDIKDYIDDDKIGNASIIGEFKEEREHWKDIIRILNKEKTYIDYKNY